MVPDQDRQKQGTDGSNSYEKGDQTVCVQFKSCTSKLQRLRLLSRCRKTCFNKLPSFVKAFF